MKLSKKIKIFKRKFLLFLESILNDWTYNLILYFLAKSKFSSAINNPASKKKFSKNLDTINNYEFKACSQNNEDGIINFLHSQIKYPDNVFFEIGFDFNEFNSLNLIKSGWSGVLIEGDKIKCDKLRVCLNFFFKNHKVKVLNKFVYTNNINSLIEDNINNLNFDFFSLDTDGMDYWILKELNFQPKIICVEFNPWLGSTESKTLPLLKNFNYKSDMYYGASLQAINRLLKKKNYKLVAIESSGNNAFFICQNFFKVNLEELNIEKSFKLDPKFSDDFYKETYKRIIKKKWINV